jgi:hypothetical protein
VAVCADLTGGSGPGEASDRAMQRQGRHLERSNSKRALDHGGGGDDDDRPSKRPRVPALAR